MKSKISSGSKMDPWGHPDLMSFKHE